MSRITRVPFGFTDLLGTKNFGDNPSELAQVVAPIIDIGQFLAVERRSFRVGSAAVQSADGTYASFTVPDGELWLIESVGTQVLPSGAGGPYECDFSCELINVANSNLGTVSHATAYLGKFQAGANVTAGGQTVNLVHDFERPLPLFADEVIQFINGNGDYTGGRQYTTRATVRYLKLNV